MEYRGQEYFLYLLIYLGYLGYLVALQGDGTLGVGSTGVWHRKKLLPSPRKSIYVHDKSNILIGQFMQKLFANQKSLHVSYASNNLLIHVKII